MKTVFRVILMIVVLLAAVEIFARCLPKGEYDKRGFTTYCQGIAIPQQYITNAPDVQSIAVVLIGMINGNSLIKPRTSKDFVFGSLSFSTVSYADHAGFAQNKVSLLIDGRIYTLPIRRYDIAFRRVDGFTAYVPYTTEWFMSEVDLPLLARLGYAQRVDVRIGNTEFEILPEHREAWKKLYFALTN